MNVRGTVQRLGKGLGLVTGSPKTARSRLTLCQSPACSSRHSRPTTQHKRRRARRQGHAGRTPASLRQHARDGHRAPQPQPAPRSVHRARRRPAHPLPRSEAHVRVPAARPRSLAARRHGAPRPHAAEHDDRPLRARHALFAALGRRRPRWGVRTVIRRARAGRLLSALLSMAPLVSAPRAQSTRPRPAFPLVRALFSVSTQSAPEGIRTPNLLLRRSSITPNGAHTARLVPHRRTAFVQVKALQA